MRLPRIEDLGELRGRRVLVRVDLNVPLDAAGRVTDDRRIAHALPTIRVLKSAGARVTVMLAPDCVGDEVVALTLALPEGGVLLLENLRFHAGEKACDPAFSDALARNGDLYVNDAFGAAHRAHASTTGVPARLPSAAGRLIVAEIEALGAVRDDPPRPLVLVFGGAKVSDKIPMIRHFLDRADHVLVGGGMAYTLLAADGVAVGGSRVETDLLDVAREILGSARSGGIDVVLPVDHVCAAEIRDGAPVSERDIVPDGMMGLDIGPRSRDAFRRALAGARAVIWNGPMGVFEIPAFAEGTRAVAQAIADLGDAVTRVVGGGDSAAAVEALCLSGSVGHVSTGGGASLAFLGGEELPAIAALARSS
jgi:phosphoglycerate kinase